MARKIVFTSGKGGVGKTTIATNIAMQLARRGEQVVLCDLDLELNNIDVLTGTDQKINFDISDAINGKCRAGQALVQHPTLKNLYILSAKGNSLLQDSQRISPQEVKVILDRLAGQFDYLLIDCPAGMEQGFHRAVAVAEEGIVVTTPHLFAIRDADKVITQLKSYRLSNVYLMVNMAHGDLLLQGKELSPREIEKLLKVPLLAVFPYSDEIYLNNTQNSKLFRWATDNMSSVNKKLKIYDPRDGYRGFLGSLRMRLKR